MVKRVLEIYENASGLSINLLKSDKAFRWEWGWGGVG